MKHKRGKEHSPGAHLLNSQLLIADNVVALDLKYPHRKAKKELQEAEEAAAAAKGANMVIDKEVGKSGGKQFANATDSRLTRTHHLLSIRRNTPAVALAFIMPHRQARPKVLHSNWSERVSTTGFMCTWWTWRKLRWTK